MKGLSSIFILIISVLSLSSCSSLLSGNKHPDPVNPIDDSAVPDSLRSLYKVDAARLAVREQVKTDSEQAVIDPNLKQRFYNALIAVYNSNAQNRDAVIDSNRIHTFPNPNLQEIVVLIAHNANWQKAWSAGNTMTGYSSLDDLMNRYGLKLESYHQWSAPNNNIAVLKSDTFWNMKAIAYQFAKIQGISSAEPNMMLGDGNDITATISNHDISLHYKVGTGDCMAGCIYEHYWNYRVGSDWSVTFLGESGRP